MTNISDYGMKMIHNDRLIARDIDQLVAVCEFSLQDGIIDQGEAENILTWLNNHTLCLDTWPASVLYDRLRDCLHDGKLDSDEQKELLDLIMSISRPPTESGIKPSTLPIDQPAPAIQFKDRNFCFTGVFDFGSRDQCIEAIESLGGIAAKSVTKKLDYLVIGNVGSDVWKHSTFGTKIIRAIELKDKGTNILIVSESHWENELKGN